MTMLDPVMRFKKCYNVVCTEGSEFVAAVTSKVYGR